MPPPSSGLIVHFALFIGVIKAKPADLTNVPFLLAGATMLYHDSTQPRRIILGLRK